MNIYSFIIILSSIIKLISSSNVTESVEDIFKDFKHVGGKILKNTSWAPVDFVPKKVMIPFNGEIHFGGNKKNFIENIRLENVTGLKLRTTEFDHGIELVEYLANNVTFTTVLKSKELRCDNYVNATAINVDVLGGIEFDISQENGSLKMTEMHKFLMKDINIIINSKFDNSCNYDVLEDTDMWNSVFEKGFGYIYDKIGHEQIKIMYKSQSEKLRIGRMGQPIIESNEKNRALISDEVIRDFFAVFGLILNMRYRFSLPISDLNTTFYFDDIIGQTLVSLQAERGMVLDLSTIHSTGKWWASISHNVLIISGEFGFRDFTLHYRKYTAKIGPIIKSGDANIVMDENSFYVRINVPFTGDTGNTKIVIKDFNVLKWSLKKVEFSNLGILDQVVTSHIKNYMSGPESQGVNELVPVLKRNFQDGMNEYLRNDNM